MLLYSPQFNITNIMFISLLAIMTFNNNFFKPINCDRILSIEPSFFGGISNVTTPVGREAMLTCVVHQLGTYKVAWLRVDTQTILTIQNSVITKNHRVAITFSEKKTWQLKIKDIRESDKGWYMCQINTDPMKSQMGYLDVVVPPDILDYPTSTDMVVNEGSNVTLRCAATGSPPPIITWRREGSAPISLPGGTQVLSVEGSTFTISKVDRLNMGAYLCIASNGVPPTVSKRVMVIVHFPPMITVPNQLIGVQEGQRVILECYVEAYPKSINYWTKLGDVVPQGGNFESSVIDNTYKIIMRLIIKSIAESDMSTYKCVAKNSLGETDGTIKLYGLPGRTINAIDSSPDRRKGKVGGGGGGGGVYGGNRGKGGNNYDSNDIVDDDPENISKRKGSMIADENFELSSSSSITAIDKTWCSSLLMTSMVALFLLSQISLDASLQPHHHHHHHHIRQPPNR